MAFDIGSVIAHIQADLSGFTSGIDEAKAEGASLGDSIGNVASNIEDFAQQAALFVGIQAVAFGGLAKQAIDVASNFEQTQTSFGTMLGSEQKAADLMKQLMLLEQQSPFDIQTITNAAKSLLAYGVSADQVTPKLRELMDMSQGQASKLQELVSIYGEVNSIQQLNGREVLRLSSIGIPIYQAIADYYNKMGNSATEAGGKISAMTNETVNNAKMTATARQNMTDTVKYDTEQLAIDQQTTAKTTQAKEKLSLAEQKLSDKISEDNAKLGTHTAALAGVGAQANVTAKDVKTMISKGEITAGVFNNILEEFTSKGGLFYQENIRQMSTFSGIMSSVNSQFQYAMLNMMGIDMGAANEVRKGGLFDTLRGLAADLLTWLHQLQPVLSSLGQNKIFQDAIIGLTIAIGSLVIILPILIAVMNPVVLIVLAIEAAIVALYVAWQQNFMGIQQITFATIPYIQAIFQGLIAFWNGVVLPALNMLRTWWQQNGSEIMMIVSTVWNLIKNIILTVVLGITGLVEGGLLLIQMYWTQHGANITAFVTGFWNIIEGIFKVALAILDTIFTLWVDFITGKWQDSYAEVDKDTQIFVQGMEDIWNGLVNILTSIGAEILQAIMSPFNNAYKQIQGIMSNIKNAIDFTQRHSPSVIDIIQNGVAEANKAMGGLADNPLLGAHPSTAFSSLFGNGNAALAGAGNYYVTIPMDGAVIGDQQSATRIGEAIGDSMIKKLKLNIRI